MEASFTMEFQSAIKLLLVLGQVLSLVVAGENATEAQPVYNTTAYAASGPKPELFVVGGDRIQTEVKGCFRKDRIICCHNQPMLAKVQGPRMCSQFGAANCCYMIPGRDQHPRLPSDLVPLLPSLSHGQCEQRRKGRRVLHCCRGALPVDPQTAGKAAMICSTVGNMKCCYHPFAGVDINIVLSGSKGHGTIALGISAVNEAEK